MVLSGLATVEVGEVEGMVHNTGEADLPVLGDVQGRDGIRLVSVCMAAKVGDTKRELEALSGSGDVDSSTVIAAFISAPDEEGCALEWLSL